MDRKVLITLLQDGMRYPTGKHLVWISRCFEITVRPTRIIEVDEYECYGEKQDGTIGSGSHADPRGHAGMYHVGRSIISAKDKRVVKEESGGGWLKPGQLQAARR